MSALILNLVYFTGAVIAFYSFNKSKLKDYDLYLASKYNNAPEVVFGKFNN